MLSCPSSPHGYTDGEVAETSVLPAATAMSKPRSTPTITACSTSIAASPFEEIPDGTSRTLLVGERFVDEYLGWVTGTRSTLRNTGTAINAGAAAARSRYGSAPATTRPPEEVRGFGSLRARGAEFTFADGKVTFLSENIDLTIYARYADRADGELTQAP